MSDRTVTIHTDGTGVYRDINASASPPGMPSPDTVHVPHSQVSDAAIVSHHKGPVYGQRCGSCGQYWPCDTEVAMATEIAINDLFDAGGVDGAPLPAACYEDGPWQAPGTVAVRVEALRALAKAAGIAT